MVPSKKYYNASDNNSTARHQYTYGRCRNSLVFLHGEYATNAAETAEALDLSELREKATFVKPQ